MAYPARINPATATIPPNTGQYWNRPAPIYAYNGNLYGVFHDRNGSNRAIEIWKSSDYGNSWAEVDILNHKIPTISGYSFSQFRDLNTLYIAWHYTVSFGVQRVILSSFDFNTDLWGVNIEVATNNPGNFFPTFAPFKINLLKRANGHFVLSYIANAGGSNRTVYYSIYDGINWGAPTQVFLTSNTQLTGGTLDKTSGRIHFFGWSRPTLETQISHRTLNSDNSFGIEQALFTNGLIANISPTGIDWFVQDLDSLNSTLIFAYIRNDGTLWSALATEAQNPTWSLVLLDNTLDFGGGAYLEFGAAACFIYAQTGKPLSLVYGRGDVTVFPGISQDRVMEDPQFYTDCSVINQNQFIVLYGNWADESLGQRSKIYYSKYNGTTWDAPVLYRQDADAFLGNPVPSNLSDVLSCNAFADAMSMNDAIAILVTNIGIPPNQSEDVGDSCPPLKVNSAYCTNFKTGSDGTILDTDCDAPFYKISTEICD